MLGARAGAQQWYHVTLWLLVVAGAAWMVLGYIAPWTRCSDGRSAPWWPPPRGLIAGLSVVFWCFATWLIPVLLAAGWWRHVRHRVPLRYEPALWSIVFPLGMYAVAGIYL